MNPETPAVVLKTAVGGLPTVPAGAATLSELVLDGLGATLILAELDAGAPWLVPAGSAYLFFGLRGRWRLGGALLAAGSALLHAGQSEALLAAEEEFAQVLALRLPADHAIASETLAWLPDAPWTTVLATATHRMYMSKPLAEIPDIDAELLVIPPGYRDYGELPLSPGAVLVVLGGDLWVDGIGVAGPGDILQVTAAPVACASLRSAYVLRFTRNASDRVAPAPATAVGAADDYLDSGSLWDAAFSTNWDQRFAPRTTGPDTDA